MKEDIQELILKKVSELAWKHAQIIENEIKQIIERFNCFPDDLIIEYLPQAEVKINIKGSHFKIENVFTYNQEKIK